MKWRENWLHALAWYQIAYDTGDSLVEDSINRVRNFLSVTKKRAYYQFNFGFQTIDFAN